MTLTFCQITRLSMRLRPCSESFLPMENSYPGISHSCSRQGPALPLTPTGIEDLWVFTSPLVISLSASVDLAAKSLSLWAGTLLPAPAFPQRFLVEASFPCCSCWFCSALRLTCLCASARSPSSVMVFTFEAWFHFVSSLLSLISAHLLSQLNPFILSGASTSTPDAFIVYHWWQKKRILWVLTLPQPKTTERKSFPCAHQWSCNLSHWKQCSQTGYPWFGTSMTTGQPSSPSLLQLSPSAHSRVVQHMYNRSCQKLNEIQNRSRLKITLKERKVIFNPDQFPEWPYEQLYLYNWHRDFKGGT